VQKPYKMLENVIYEIESGLKININADYLADKFAMSPTNLRRLFKNAFGQSIGTYIRSRKMAASIDDLKKTNLNVLDIAFAYGLDYEQSFIRAFKREYGLTPGKLRKSGKPVDIKPPFSLIDFGKQENAPAFGPDVITEPKYIKYNGLKFEYWRDTGNGIMAPGADGSFKCKWNKAGDALFRTGK